jgi:UDP-N-acetylglucosamine 2-epimerase (non-hydrolysing)
VGLGTNTIVGQDPGRILAAYTALGEKGPGESQIPPLWDGGAAKRVVNILLSS